ncbi:hypothetical protein ACWET9_24880 [Streptomyces sp. NPDC004059]
MATRDLVRLAKYVKAHRLEQYSSRDAAAAAAGVVRNTWKRVEEGQEVQDSTYARIEKALGWVAGSCIAIAEGGEPAFTGGAAGADVPVKFTPEQAHRAVLDAARAALPDTPLRNIDAFGEELVEILRRAGVVTDGS